MINSMTVGEKIRLRRKELNMTLEELGNKIGVGKSTVRKWENGMIANMKKDKIKKIADALNISPSYLMGWSQESMVGISNIYNYKKNLNSIYENFGFEEYNIIETYNKLPSRGRKELMEHIKNIQNKYNIETTSEKSLEAALKNCH